MGHSFLCCSSRDREKDKEKDKEKEKEAEREKKKEIDRERRKKGLPPMKKDHLAGKVTVKSIPTIPLWSWFQSQFSSVTVFIPTSVLMLVYV